MSRPMGGYAGGGYGAPTAMATTSNKFSPADWQASNMSHYNRSES